MQLSDLLPIGRLGKVFNNTGYISFRPSELFRPALFSSKKFFLIFNSDRVFYVTLDKIKFHQNKFYLRFVEDGIIEELENFRKPRVMIEKEFYYQSEGDTEYHRVTEYKVSFKGEEIGIVEEIWEDGFQDRLIVVLNDGRDVIIPDVEQYVERKDSKLRTVFLKNVEELLEL